MRFEQQEGIEKLLAAAVIEPIMKMELITPEVGDR
jgi:hypothetical protein